MFCQNLLLKIFTFFCRTHRERYNSIFKRFIIICLKVHPRHSSAMDGTAISPPSWYVYIVQCRDNTLYTGITTNLSRRLREHNSQKHGARYTRPRRPVKLVYYETAQSRSSASSREYRIKQLSAAEKKQLIGDFSSTNPK